MNAGPLPFEHLPFGWLLDPVSATERFAAAGLPVAGVAATYVRYKPGETSIVGLRLTGHDGTTSLAYARWCAEAARAATIHAKALTLAPKPSRFGPGVALLDPTTVVYGFPNDARLRRLHRYGTNHRMANTFRPLNLDPGLARAGHDLEVLRYKPERRLVSVARLATGESSGSSSGSGSSTVSGPGGVAFRTVLVRYTTRPRAPFLGQAARLLLNHGIATPAPLGHLEDGHVGVDTFVAGRDLTDAVRAGSCDPEALAADLGRLHQVPPTALPFDLHCPRQTRVRVGHGLDGLSQWRPELTGACQSLAGDLDRHLARHRPDATDPVVIHGDLDGGNVMVDGSTHWLIDLERISLGSPAADLGRLVAHALALEILRPGWSPGAVDHATAVVEAYRRRHPLAPHDLAWHTALGLADRALLVNRQFLAPGPERTPQLIDAARTALTTTNRPTVGAQP